MISVSGTAPESQLSLVGGEVGDKESERGSIEPVEEVVALNVALWTSSWGDVGELVRKVNSTRDKARKMVRPISLPVGGCIVENQEDSGEPLLALAQPSAASLRDGWRKEERRARDHVHEEMLNARTQRVLVSSSTKRSTLGLLGVMKMNSIDYADNGRPVKSPHPSTTLFGADGDEVRSLLHRSIDIRRAAICPRQFSEMAWNDEHTG
jgi:hypothetical protein